MKKYFIILMCFALTLLMCACSSEKLSLSDQMNAYERIECSIAKEYSDTTIHVLDSTASKCLYIESKFEYEDGNPKFVVMDIFEFDYNTGKSCKLNLDSKEKDYSFFYTTDDSLIAIDMEQNIYVFDSQGQVALKTNLMELNFGNQVSDKCRINAYYGVKGDDTYIYVNGVNNDNQGVVLVLDRKLVGRNAFLSDAGWTLLVVKENQIGFVDNKDNHIYMFNENNNSIIDAGKTAEGVINESTTAGLVRGNAEYDYFYYTRGNRNQESGAAEDFLVGIAGQNKVKLCDFSTMGIDNLYIEQIVSDQQNGFWVWGTLADQEMKVYHLVSSENAQNYSVKKDKICCKIGSYVILDPTTKYVIDQFNSQSENYYFETVLYQNVYQDRDVALMHMFLDCQEGKLDGILLDNIEETFSKDDILLDLNNYLQNSKVVSKEVFIPHYLESVTDETGNIYALYPSFKAFGYAFEDQIDFSDLQKYLSMCEESKTFFSYRGSEDALAYLLTYSGKCFVDEISGEIHIQEKPFKQMLEFVKEQDNCKTENFDPVMQYCAGESLATRIQISEPCDFLYFNELFHKKVVFTNVGADGLVIGEKKGLLAICSKSQHKEAFYDYYDFMFDRAFYHNTFFAGMNLPVLQDEYRLWKDYFLAREDYEDEYGKFNRKYDFQIGMGAAECIIEVGSISEQEAEEAIDTIMAVQYVKPMRESYKLIILDEAAGYFAGNRNLEEVCANIENRIRIALEENEK